MGAGFHLYRMGWIADYPDPDNFMTLFTSYSEQNHTQWGDPKYDRLVEDAKSLLNPKKRARLYDKAQKILLDEVTAIIPLYLYAFNVMYDENVVKGVHMNPLDTWQYDTVYLNRK